jgi:hypothetical protein
MTEITIYTNDGDCANGVAEINPFTVGDATDEWTLKFNDGTGFYAPSNVTMRVGHTNGLPNGTYTNAFKWVDRAGNESTGSISVSSGVPTLSFNTNPAGGVVGTNGVYILRGPELDGSISNISLVDGGYGYAIDRFGPALNSSPTYKKVKFIGSGSGSGFVALGNVTEITDGSSKSEYGYVNSVSLVSGGKDYSLGDEIIDVNQFNSDSNVQVRAILSFDVNAARYEFPFKRDESGNNIIAATTLSPYSDGEISGSTQYDHSTLVIRPETVATASLTQSGTDWVGTMNPINSYVTERLALRNSTQLDIQIRGDGRTLFQGQLTVLNKIA